MKGEERLRAALTFEVPPRLDARIEQLMQSTPVVRRGSGRTRVPLWGCVVACVASAVLGFLAPGGGVRGTGIAPTPVEIVAPPDASWQRLMIPGQVCPPSGFHSREAIEIRTLFNVAESPLSAPRERPADL